MTRKASLEQRALAVISTSGGLVTLILALGALLLGKPSEAAELLPRLLLVTAVGVFVSAAVMALVANRPKTYWGFSNDDIDRMVSEWNFEKDEAEVKVAHLRAESLKVASDINNRKAGQVQLAVSLAVLGVALVAAAIVAVLLID